MGRPRCLPPSTSWKARSSVAACNGIGIRNSSAFSTPSKPRARPWLKPHPRFCFHFTPTSASWLNAVEGYFAKLTRSRLKRGVFHSIVDLQAAINRFLAETNDKPKPFIWTADPDKIIAAVDRGRQVLDSIH